MRRVGFLFEHNKIMGEESLRGRHALQLSNLLLSISQRRMQVLILNHKLLTLFHVLTLEKILQITLQSLQHSLQPPTNLLSLGQISPLDNLVYLKDLHHKLRILHIDLLRKRHPPQLHQIDRPLQIVEQGSLGLVYIGRIFGHLLVERVRTVFAEAIGVELLLQILGHITNRLGVDRVVLGTGYYEQCILKMRK